QSRLPDYVLQAPPLQLGQRTRLFQANDVAHARGVVLVMGVELLVMRNHAHVETVPLRPRHFDDDGLFHLVGDDFSNHCLLPSGFSVCCRVGHIYLFSDFWAASSCSRTIVLIRAMSLRRPRIFFRLSVCPMLS